MVAFHPRSSRRWLYIGSGFALVAVLIVAIVPAVIITNRNKQQSSHEGAFYAQDESQYSNLTRMVSLDHLDSKQRIFVVGDVHGCANELSALVTKLQYNQTTDAMILAGDLVSKGYDNPGVLRLAKAHGMYCVRGNHDDYVIRFKTFENIHGVQRMAPPKAYLPEGNVADPMKFKDEHAAIAVNLTMEEYDYLVQCPMVLDLPFMNARVVHGGVDPNIQNVTQNDPHTVFNMRDIADGVPTRDNKAGTHWTDAYNEKQLNNTPPIKIYYGHDASRGLDLENVTFGLDSRCVYGGSLTAMDIKTHQYTQVKLLLCATPICKAAQIVEYNVVVVRPAVTVAVAIGDEMYPLQPHPTIPFLHTGSAPGESTYRYVQLDPYDYEAFERPALMHAERTFNEVYGRPWNQLRLPVLPKVFDIPFDNGPSLLYEDGVIANLFFEFDPVTLDLLHSDKMNTVAKIDGKLSYISHDHVQQFEQVSLKVGGHSSRTWAKVPYKLKLKTQDGLYDRWSLKLRPEATDATLIREKLYSDVLQASGVLGPQGAYARVYFNGRPVGLYLITDDITDESFLRQTIHHGSEQANIGAVVKADAGKGEYAADLAYHGETIESYDPLVYVAKGEEGAGMAGLIELTRFIAQFDLATHPSANNSAALYDQWNQKIHLPHFLRQVACEWLGGNWDATVYCKWVMGDPFFVVKAGNNYILYKHPKSQQIVTMPMDFDFTFGNGLEADQRKLMTGRWVDFTAERMVHSYLWEKVMSVPAFQEMFIDALHRINDHVTNPAALLPRAQALAYMIEPEVAWDQGIERWTAGTTSRRLPNSAPFLQALEQGTGADDDKIGMIEWIQQKYEAVVADLKVLDGLAPEEKEPIIMANAQYIQGIPRVVFERAEEALGEEIGEDAKDLIMPLANLKLRQSAAVST